jgi:hypothetical protein
MFFEKNGAKLTARDYSKLAWVHSTDCDCIEGKRWSKTILINKYVQ